MYWRSRPARDLTQDRLRLGIVSLSMGSGTPAAVASIFTSACARLRSELGNPGRFREGAVWQVFGCFWVADVALSGEWLVAARTPLLRLESAAWWL